MRSGRWWAAMGMIAFAAGCSHPPAVDPRRADAPAATKTLLAALASNDAVTARQCVAPGEQQTTLLDLTLAMFSAEHGAADAAAKRFGDGTPIHAANPLPAFQVKPGEIDSAKLTVSGNLAMLEVPARKVTFHLRKDPTGWTVDLDYSLLPGIDVNNPDTLDTVRDVFTGTQAAANKLRSEIEAGQYADAASAGKALSGAYSGVIARVLAGGRGK